jgi:tetratricopeptide (TPR) repeat protein
VPRAIERWSGIRQLERAVAANPHDAAARADLGRLLVEAGRPARALPHLEMAAARAPEVAETAYYLGAACLGAGDLARGRPLIEGALARDPKLRYGEPHLALGDYFLAHGQPAEALPHLERFTAIHASSVEGRYKLARAALGAGEPARARAALDEAVEVYRAAPPFKRREERIWRLKAAWLGRRVPATRMVG